MARLLRANLMSTTAHVGKGTAPRADDSTANRLGLSGLSESGGRSGIRTHGRVAPTLDFESSAISVSFCFNMFLSDSL